MIELEVPKRPTLPLTINSNKKNLVWCFEDAPFTGSVGSYNPYSASFVLTKTGKLIISVYNKNGRIGPWDYKIDNVSIISCNTSQNNRNISAMLADGTILTSTGISENLPKNKPDTHPLIVWKNSTTALGDDVSFDYDVVDFHLGRSSASLVDKTLYLYAIFLDSTGTTHVVSKEREGEPLKIPTTDNQGLWAHNLTNVVKLCDRAVIFANGTCKIDPNSIVTSACKNYVESNWSDLVDIQCGNMRVSKNTTRSFVLGLHSNGHVSMISDYGGVYTIDCSMINNNHTVVSINLTTVASASSSYLSASNNNTTSFCFINNKGELHTVGTLPAYPTTATPINKQNNYDNIHAQFGLFASPSMSAGPLAVSLYKQGNELKFFSSYLGSYPPAFSAPLWKRGLITQSDYLDFTQNTAVTGFTFSGVEPTGTDRALAFKVDGVWNKLNISDGTMTISNGTSSVPVTVPSGEAVMESLSTQTLTAESVLDEGNSVLELSDCTSIPPFVGKQVQTAVALYADGDSEVMPTFGMSVNAQVDTTTAIYSWTEYSQEYQISASDPIQVVSVIADTTTTGNGSVAVTARLYDGSAWGEYMPLLDVQMQTATAIQLKSVYTVQSTDGTDSAKVNNVTIKYSTGTGKVAGATTDIVTKTQVFKNDVVYANAFIKHNPLIDAQINCYISTRKEPQKRTMLPFGNGTGAIHTYQLDDEGINQDTLVVYADGIAVADFGYNTETSELTVTAEDGAALSASYEYGWELSDWLEMDKEETQSTDYGYDITRYSYTVPSHTGSYTISAIKYELERPEGTVTDEVIGVGTGKRQLIYLPHIAKKETIVCNGQWSYNYDRQLLTVIAPEGDDIVISYDWIAESPRVHGVMAGWTD